MSRVRYSEVVFEANMGVQRLQKGNSPEGTARKWSKLQALDHERWAMEILFDQRVYIKEALP